LGRVEMEDLSAETKLTYSEAFCYFQEPVKKGQKLTGKLSTKRLPEALGAMGMALPTDSRVWARLLKNGKFNSLYQPKPKVDGFIDFEDYVFLLEKGPQLLRMLLGKIKEEPRKGFMSQSQKRKNCSRPLRYLIQICARQSLWVL